jgi:anti-sigma-K factor RskA
MKDLEKQERLFDLLTAEAVDGLNEKDTKELKDLLTLFPEWKDDDSLALTATAINLSAFSADEEMPAHLKSKILADSEKYFATQENSEKVLQFDSKAQPSAIETEPSIGFFERLFSANWLGWAVAAAACVALALNLWLARPQPPVIVQNPLQVTPTVPPSLMQQREQLLASASDVVTRSWSDFDKTKPRGVQGDVVWSNSQQKGFVRFRGLPANDKTKETYQVWIFDDNQKNPVSAGIFDVNQDGEVIVPMNAALQIQKPTMIGITAEKPGGVVVSALGKVMAVAKV